MSESFSIEFAQGLSATVYISSTLSAGDLLELHRAVERLPCTAHVLRIQLTNDVAAGMPRGLGEFVRYWRETRHRPVHLTLVPRRAVVRDSTVTVS
jgi:hypothetical protein